MEAMVFELQQVNGLTYEAAQNQLGLVQEQLGKKAWLTREQELISLRDALSNRIAESKQQGFVKTFNEDTGSGVIATTSGHNYLVNRADLVNCTTLREGQQVSFVSIKVPAHQSRRATEVTLR